tara:strand:+ start:763 stop:909 length:147 start_codon:yes stop_codon:yes gene_type:complete
MAKAKGWTSFLYRKNTIQKRTSIGKSKNSRPKNKYKKKSWKKYRGQGR